MLTAIIYTSFAFLGFGIGLFIYEAGKRQGYQHGYDKADSFHKSNNKMNDYFKQMLNRMEAVHAAHAAETAKRSDSHSDNSK